MERPLDQLAKRHARFYLDQASASFSQAQSKSMDGDIAGAESSAEAGQTFLTKAKGVQSLWETFASKLEQSGYTIPPLEIFIGKQTSPTTGLVENRHQLVEPSSVTPTTPSVEARTSEVQDVQAPIPLVQEPILAIPEKNDQMTPAKPEIQMPIPQPILTGIENESVSQPNPLASPSLDTPISGEPSTPTAVETTPPKRVDGDLGPREEELLYARFKLNDERDNFAHTKASDLVHAVFGEQLDQITDPKVKRQRIQSRTNQVEDSMVKIEFKLRSAGFNPEKTPHYMGKFFDSLKSQPELAHLTNDQIRAVIAGNLQFKDLVLETGEASQVVPPVEANEAAPKRGVSITVIDAPAAEVMARVVAKPSTEAPVVQTTSKSSKNRAPGDAVTIDGIDIANPVSANQSKEVKDSEPVDPKLSEVEVYALAKRLGEVDIKLLEAVGVKLTDDDIEELQMTVEKLIPEDQSLAESSAADLLEFKKVEAFLKNKAEVFTANLDDEDAQYVLTILAGVSDSNRLKGLLTPDVKKSS
jgi:hypothetical protein